MTNPKHQEKMTSITIEDLSSCINHKGVDTLMLSKLLQRFDFSQQQAEVFSEIVKQSTFNNEQFIKEKNLEDISNLVKKEDLTITKKELEFQIEKVRSDLIKWVAGLMIANTGLLFTLIKFFN